MDIKNKTDEEILDKLKNIYRRVTGEDEEKISFADLNELSETEPKEQPGKKPPPLAFYGTIFLAVCLFLGIVLTVIIRTPGVPDIKPTVKTTYSIPITILPASPKADLKTPSETETDEGIPPAPVKKEETEKRKEIEPATEKPYTIQISAIRNFKIAKDFLKKIEASQPDVHLEMFNSKKYGVWYRVFTGHFASKTEALKYMKEKNIREAYPGSYILKITASPLKR
jgi:septal ring-binding cell division protein DamX